MPIGTTCILMVSMDVAPEREDLFNEASVTSERMWGPPNVPEPC